MPFLLPPSPPPFRRQRGAIGLLAALVLLPAVLFTALALDTGRLYLEKRRLQTIADLSALDAAHAMACASAKDAAAVDAAQASAVRNGYAGNLAAENGVKVGNVSSNAQGLRVFGENGPANADAVQIEAQNTVPASLVAGGLFGGSVTLKAKAVGRSDAIAGISAGSFLARVDPSGLNPLLSGLLGTSVDLVSYNGIAAANLTLLDLIQAQGLVGTVDELLALQMSIGEFYALMASALTNKGNAGAAADLSGLAAGISNTLVLTLGDLLKVTTDDPEAAAEAEVNVLDLLMLGAEVANGQNAIAIPAAGFAIPGVASIGLSLRLIEPPQIAIGPAGQDENGNWKTQVQTAQVRVGVDLQLVPQSLSLGLLGLLLGLVTIDLTDLHLDVDAAPTTAWLENIGCSTLGDLDGSATVGSQPGVVKIAIGELDAEGESVAPTNIATVRSSLLGNLATIGASAVTSVTSDPQTTQFNGTFPDPETVGTPVDEAVNNALSSLADSLNLQVMLGSLDLSVLNQVINALSLALGPIIEALGDNLLTPLLQALGVNVGGADLTVFDVRFVRPTLVI